MSIHGALYSLLYANATVKAAVGTRIYRVVAPQGEPVPLIVYQRTSVNRERTHSGNLRYLTSQFAVTCWATSHDAALTLAGQVQAALDETSGTYDGTTIQRCWLNNETDMLYYDPEAEGARRIGIRQVYEIVHDE